jgi:hypothetical protein
VRVWINAEKGVDLTALRKSIKRSKKTSAKQSDSAGAMRAAAKAAHRRAADMLKEVKIIQFECCVDKYSTNGVLWMTIRLLEQVYDTLKAANLTNSEREFCEQWLAKSECYMRTLRFKNLEPSAEALATLSSKLGYYVNELARRNDETSAHWFEVLKQARKQTQTVLEVRVRQRWQSVCSQ